MMELIKEIILDFIDDMRLFGIKQSEELFSDYFTADEWEKRFGRDDRFPSAVSVAVRFLCRNLHFVVPVLYVVVLIASVVNGATVVAALLGGAFKTIWYSLLIALGFFALMLMESFAKIISCLILYDELPGGAENPADALLMYLTKKKT